MCPNCTAIVQYAPHISHLTSVVVQSVLTLQTNPCPTHFPFAAVIASSHRDAEALVQADDGVGAGKEGRRVAGEGIGLVGAEREGVPQGLD